MDKFIKCPKSHVYESRLEECPYCNGKIIDDELKELPPGYDNRDDILPPSPLCYAPHPLEEEGSDGETF